MRRSNETIATQVANCKTTIKTISFNTRGDTRDTLYVTSKKIIYTIFPLTHPRQLVRLACASLHCKQHLSLITLTVLHSPWQGFARTHYFSLSLSLPPLLFSSFFSLPSLLFCFYIFTTLESVQFSRFN